MATFIILVMFAASAYESVMAVNKSKEIHIACFAPSFATDRYGYVTAIKLAVDEINNHTTYLPDHKMIMHYVDTSGHVGVGLQGMFQLLYEKPVKIALLGPAYSDVTEPVARLGAVNGLIQISYAALLPKLLDKTRYNFFLRSTPSMFSFNLATIAVLQKFKWKRIGILFDYSNPLYTEAVSDLQKNMGKSDFDIASLEGFSSRLGKNLVAEVQRLKKLDVRIIIAETTHKGAIWFFCEIYKNKMYGSKYIHIMSGGLKDKWYTDLSDYKECTPQQLKIASQGYLYITRMDLRKDGKKAVSGMNSSEFYEKVKSMNPKALKLTSFAYDATYALAETFDKAAKVDNITTFQYKQFQRSWTYFSILKALDFEGVSGPLKFDAKGERLGHVMLRQFRNDVRYDIARHNGRDNNLSFYPGALQTMFNGRSPPLDHAVVRYFAKRLPISVISIMWALAVMGLVVASFFLYFNIRYRKDRLIKMSSPKINNVIIIGSMLCYVAVFLFGLDTRIILKHDIPRMCNMFVWTLTIGFTLSFGGLFSKTWRVYKIFTAAKSMERVAILDLHLFGIIIIFLCVDIAILVVWTIISPYNLSITEASRKENTLKDIIEVTQVYHCTAKFALHFSSTIFAYKGIVLLLGLFLAWETRKVQVAALNDSKFIGMAVYNVAALSAIGVTCTYALSSSQSSQEAGYMVVCLCIILCNTVTICLVFVPKLSQLFSKNTEEATDVSRISLDKVRALSVLSGDGTVARKRDTFARNRGGTFNFVKQKHTRKATESSLSSSADTAGLDQFDTKAWSLSMSELSENSKRQLEENGPLPGSPCEGEVRNRKESSTRFENNQIRESEDTNNANGNDNDNEDAITKLPSIATSRLSMERSPIANSIIPPIEPEVDNEMWKVNKCFQIEPESKVIADNLPEGMDQSNGDMGSKLPNKICCENEHGRSEKMPEKPAICVVPDRTLSEREVAQIMVDVATGLCKTKL